MSIRIPDAYRNPTVRTTMLAIFAFGFSGAATAPYSSIVGIHELGLSDRAYSMLLAAAAAVNVVISILVGNIADRLGDYRRMMVFVALFGIAGYGAIYLLPAQSTFVFSGLLLLPAYGALNSLLFANARAATNRMKREDVASVNSGVRAMISLSWVLVPGITGALLAGSPSMLPAYLFSTLAAVACLGLIVVFLPKVAPGDALVINHLSYWAALAHVATPRILVRVLGVSLVTSMLHVNGAVLSLIVTGPVGGNVADVGILIGIVALLEVIFIVALAPLIRRIGAMATLAVGTMLYVTYLGLLGLSTAVWQVYALSLISGAGAAALISIPITYLQDLIADRPGLGSALISVNMFLGAGLGALIFGLGTAVSGYSGTAILSALAGGGGIALLLALDGLKSRHAEPQPS
ncbi:MFS transporter [Xaviernesmea oryzae]|uniref:MFS transporter n=2 Tax=Xaviernesmea oryzae TaxID=464029 RepID=A0A1Q9AYZ3_9HYPH|nr:MFS transporter [Xaviernesmea oryzae]SEL21451.1 Predicted arabinose efflux permease, MFS family [Xaviernesmea oryzae]